MNHAISLGGTIEMATRTHCHNVIMSLWTTRHTLSYYINDRNRTSKNVIGDSLGTIVDRMFVFGRSSSGDQSLSHVFVSQYSRHSVLEFEAPHITSNLEHAYVPA